MTTCALTEKAIVLKPEDDVAVARTPVSAGTVLEDGPVRIEVRADIRSSSPPTLSCIATWRRTWTSTEEIIAVASGKRTKSEWSGVGEEEFAPWIIGPVS